MKGIKNLTVRALCEGAIMLAMALILSLINLVPSAWNFGGSVTLEMLPIIVFCIRWGFGPGMIVSFAYSVLTMLIGNGIAYGWQSIIGDYLIAFTLLGFAGLFHGKKNGFVWGTVVACALRFLAHYVAGATIWAEYMPDDYFGMTMTTPWFYSALYNGSYMILSFGLTLVVGLLLQRNKAVRSLMNGDDIRK